MKIDSVRDAIEDHRESLHGRPFHLADLKDEIEALQPLLLHLPSGDSLALSEATWSDDSGPDEEILKGDISFAGHDLFGAELRFEAVDAGVDTTFTLTVPTSSIPDLLGVSVDGVCFACTVGANRAATIAIRGMLNVGSFQPLPLSAVLSGETEDLVVSADLSAADLSTFDQLAELLGGAEVAQSLPAGVKAVKDLSVHDFRFAIDLSTVGLRWMSVDMRWESTWDVVPKVAVGDVYARATLFVSDGPSRQVEATVGGTLTLGGVPIQLEAYKAAGDTVLGSAFKGTMITGLGNAEAPRLSQLIDDVANRVGAKAVALPALIPDVALDTFEVEVSPSAGSFQVSGQFGMTLELDGSNELDAAADFNFGITAEGFPHFEVVLGLEATEGVEVVAGFAVETFDLTFAYEKYDENSSGWTADGRTKLQLFGGDVTLKVRAEKMQDQSELRFELEQSGVEPITLSAVQLEATAFAVVLASKQDGEIRSRSFSLDVSGALTVASLSDFANFDEPTLRVGGHIGLSSGEGRTRLSFQPGAGGTYLRPLELLPGFADDVASLVTISLAESYIEKSEGVWHIGVGLTMVIENEPEQTNPVYRTLNSAFPADGDHVLTGALEYDLKEGLTLTLDNNSALVIPSLLNRVGARLERLDPELHEEFAKANGWVEDHVGPDPHEMLDFGDSLVWLRRIAFHLGSELRFDTTFAFALPSKLNDRVFGDSDFHGLIHTYPGSDGEPLTSIDPVSRQEILAPYLQQATMSLSTKGGISVTGSVDQLNVINLAKLDELIEKAGGAIEVSRLIGQEDDALLFNLDAFVALVDSDRPMHSVASFKDEENTPGTLEYGAFSLQKPKFSLNTTTGAFSCSGGFRLRSQQIRLPLRSVFKTVSLLLVPKGLPQHSPEEAKFQALYQALQDYRQTVDLAAEYLAETVDIKSRTMIGKNADDGRTLDLTELSEVFLSVLSDKGKAGFQDELDAVIAGIAEHSTNIVDRLPTRLTEYMSIEVPQGLMFEFELTADKSVSFRLEVPPWTGKGEKPKDFADRIQVLVPVVGAAGPVPLQWLGIRLKKVGFGSAVFNQAFRLDLSIEVDYFDVLQIVFGVADDALLDRYDELGPGEGDTILPPERLLRFWLPGAEGLRQSIEVDDLTLLLFIVKIAPSPPFIIPIPVPTFYREIHLAYQGLLGQAFEFCVKFPPPELDPMAFLAHIGELIALFSDVDAPMTVESYGGKTDEPADFEVGPVYARLPGIVGYETSGTGVLGTDVGDGERERITLGTTSTAKLYAKDVLNMLMNTVKFSLVSLTRPNPVAVPTNPPHPPDEARLPINYFVGYTPEEHRVVHKDIHLFLDAAALKLSWAIAAADEMKEDDVRIQLGAAPRDPSEDPLVPGDLTHRQGLLLFSYVEGDLLHDLVRLTAFTLSSFMLARKAGDGGRYFALTNQSDIAVYFSGRRLFWACAELTLTSEGLRILGKVDVPPYVPIDVRSSATLELTRDGGFAIGLEFEAGVAKLGGLLLRKPVEPASVREGARVRSGVRVRSGMWFVVDQAGLVLQVQCGATLLGTSFDVQGALAIGSADVSGHLQLSLVGEPIKIGDFLAPQLTGRFTLHLGLEGSYVHIENAKVTTALFGEHSARTIKIDSHGNMDFDIEGRLTIGKPAILQLALPRGLEFAVRDEKLSVTPGGAPKLTILNQTQSLENVDFDKPIKKSFSVTYGGVKFDGEARLSEEGMSFAASLGINRTGLIGKNRFVGSAELRILNVRKGNPGSLSAWVDGKVQTEKKVKKGYVTWDGLKPTRHPAQFEWRDTLSDLHLELDEDGRFAVSATMKFKLRS